MEPSSWFVTANGIQLRALRWGEAASTWPVAVCVIGSSFPALTWRVVAELLAGGYVVYAYDRRGHSESSKPEIAPGTGRNYDFSDFAADLAGLLEALALRDVYLVAHSAGATDALLLADQRPELVRRVFAFEPTVAHPLVARPGPRLAGSGDDGVAGRRRGKFGSREEVFARYGSRPPFNVWRAAALWDYVSDGLEQFDEKESGAAGCACSANPSLRRKLTWRSGRRSVATRCWRGPSIRFRRSSRFSARFADMGRSVGSWIPPDGGGRGAGDSRRTAGDGALSTHFLSMQLPETLVGLVRAFDGRD